MLIYLLYDYEECGPENLIADVDPARFRERAGAWLLRLPSGNCPDGALAELDKALVSGVAGKHPLWDGWGAPVVEIVGTDS